MSNWLLFVDETGDFFARQEPVAVAGVLLQSIDQPAFRARLREGISATHPAVPWPLHATILRVPASRPAFVSFLSTQKYSIPSSVAASCAPARERMKTAPSGSALARLQERSSVPIGRWEPPDSENYDAISKADQALRLDRTSYAPLEQLVSEQAQAMIDFCRNQASRCYATTGLWGAAVYDQGSKQSPSERYLPMLETLLVRVRNALLLSSSVPSAHTLWVYVATRSLDNNDPQNTLLSAAALGRIAAAVDRYPSPRSECSVTLAVCNPRAYRSGTHAGLILADWVANRTRNALRGNFGLEETLDDFAFDTGFNPRFSLSLPEQSVLSLVTAMPSNTKKWAVEERTRTAALMASLVGAAS